MERKDYWNSLDQETRDEYIVSETLKIKAFGGASLSPRNVERKAMIAAYDHHQVDQAKAAERNATRDAYDRGFALVNGTEIALDQCPQFIIDMIEKAI